MRQVEVRAAVSTLEVARVRGLIREYGAYLADNSLGAPNRASAATICIVGLERELAGLPVGYESPGVLLLGWVDGHAEGCLAVRELRPTGVAAEAHEGARDGLALEVKRLWVRPEARGVGLGRRLMEAALEHARAVDARRVYLDTVRAAMPEAIALYEAMGFRPVGRYNDNAVAGVEFFSLELAPGSGVRGLGV